jgi:aspartyl-tRNA(Asn)/glutamyl-tRNA(Gln) amidotransferase subunit C
MEREEVLKVASLARLSLTDEEIGEFGRQLNQILGYVETLNEVDVEQTEPMPHAVDEQNIFRNDECRESLPRDAALSNAPRSDGSYFLVPQILEQKDA